ncbi:MAG TPA: EAL domain-containing protein, partial [Gammaproteobacteria bacterium]
AGYLYQLHLDESGPSAGDPRPMFPQETARQTLRVPGAHWELRLAPAKPWNHPPTFFVYLALLLSTTVLVAYVAFTLIWQPIHLRQEVARSGQALREANERYLAVFNGVREVIFQLGLRGELRLLNPAWEEITGFSVSASAGRPLAEFLHPEDLDDCQEMVNAAIAHTEEHQAGELRLRGRGNEVRWVEVEMHAIPDEQGGIAGVAGSMRDVTERKRADQLIHYQAHFDALTNLPNRKLFLDRFGRAIETSLRNERRLALMFVDLDRFKWINDSLGHAAGDVLLKEVAMRLSACVRKADTVARFGGDEFIVLLAEIGAAIDAEVVARKILVELNRPFLLNGHEETISGSIGITVCPDDGRDITTLMNNADNVMYHVKEAGRNDFQFFTAAMNQALQERHRMASALRQALAARELRLEYQTVVALQGRQVIGIEALLRWHSDEFGVVQPDRVIALAEDTQLIGPLGGWIIEQACRDFLAARERLPRLEFVTVNVSDRQFRAHGLAELPAILARHGMQPAQFCIDITESLVTEGREEVWSDLDAFRQLGVRIMLDDFGTGLSSLNHLKRLAPSAVKLQSDYLAGIVPEASAAAMIGSVIAMAHSMGMRVVGEGVEEARQAEMLELLGCDYAQGYLFERPLPIAGLLQQCADSHRGSEAGGRAG